MKNRMRGEVRTDGLHRLGLSVIDLAVLIDALHSFVVGSFSGRRGPTDVDDAARILAHVRRVYALARDAEDALASVEEPPF